MAGDMGINPASFDMLKFMSELCQNPTLLHLINQPSLQNPTSNIQESVSNPTLIDVDSESPEKKKQDLVMKLMKYP